MGRYVAASSKQISRQILVSSRTRRPLLKVSSCAFAFYKSCLFSADTKTQAESVRCFRDSRLAICHVQCAGLLCEHDLVPVLGLPRPAAEVGGATGTAVTTSCLVREVDVLEPGSLLMATSGEGYAPDLACPCVTVASELDNTMGLGHAGGVALEFAGSVDVDVGGEASRGVERHVKQGPAPPVALEADRPPPSYEPIAVVMDNDEVLVETMDDETGLCLGKRVPVGDLRHSTSFFGRELDDGGVTVKQVNAVWRVGQS